MTAKKTKKDEDYEALKAAMEYITKLENDVATLERKIELLLELLTCERRRKRRK